MSKKTINKVSAELKNFLTSNGNQHVEVVIELDEQPDEHKSKPSINDFKAKFNEQVKPVTSFIEENGGNVIDSTWINQTIKASLPCGKVKEIANLNGVSLVDLPRKLEADI